MREVDGRRTKLATKGPPQNCIDTTQNRQAGDESSWPEARAQEELEEEGQG